MHSCCGRVFAEEASFGAHQEKLHPHPYRISFKHAWEGVHELAATIEYARQFSTDQRKSAAKSGAALPDGSFPIQNKQDLKNAIKAVGRASNPDKAKAHIKKMAKKLDASNLIPSEWASVGIQGIQGAPSVITNPEADTVGLPYNCDYCGRKFASETAEKLHESLVHASQLPAGQSQDGVTKKTGVYGVPSSTMTNDTSVSHAEDKKKNGTPQPSHLKNGTASNVNSSGGAGSGAGNSAANTTGPGGEMANDGGNGNGAGNSAAHVSRDVTQPQPSSVNDDDEAWLVVDNADKPESYDDIRQVVNDAITDLTTNTLTGDTCYIWIVDLSDTWAVFSRRGDYYKVAYTMDDSGKVTFTGKVQSVTRRTIYVPDPDDDEDDTLTLTAAATGHKKKKNGKEQPSHLKNGHENYVLGIAAPYTPNVDPDNDGDVDTPGQADNDKSAVTV